MRRLIFLFLITSCASIFGQTGTLIDEFDDTLSTALSDHTADSGHSWTYNGTPTLTILECTVGWGDCSGQAAQIGGSAVHNRFAYSDVGFSDFTLTCKVYISNSSGTTLVGFPFRFSSSNNYMLTYIQLNSGTFTLILRRVENGSLGSIIDSETINCSGGCDYKIVADGSDIDIYIDDVLEVEGTDSFNSTETKHGVYGWYSGGAAQYEDLNISEILLGFNFRRRGLLR